MLGRVVRHSIHCLRVNRAHRMASQDQNSASHYGEQPRRHVMTADKQVLGSSIPSPSLAPNGDMDELNTMMGGLTVDPPSPKTPRSPKQDSPHHGPVKYRSPRSPTAYQPHTASPKTPRSNQKRSYHGGYRGSPNSSNNSTPRSPNSPSTPTRLDPSPGTREEVKLNDSGETKIVLKWNYRTIYKAAGVVPISYEPTEDGTLNLRVMMLVEARDGGHSLNFPGGKIDPIDEQDPLQTALREMNEETRGLFSFQQAAMSASFHSAFPHNAMYYNSGKYMILCMPVGYLPIESINALFKKAAVVKDKTEEMCWLEPNELLNYSNKPFNVNDHNFQRMLRDSCAIYQGKELQPAVSPSTTPLKTAPDSPATVLFPNELPNK